MDLFPNETVIFQWLLFMTALVALNIGVFRPVLHLIYERRERTAGEREKAQQLAKRADHVLKECEEAVAAARAAGCRDRETLLDGVGKFNREVMRTVRQEIDRQMAALRVEIEKKGREASLHLKSYAQEIGKEIAEVVLKRGV